MRGMDRLDPTRRHFLAALGAAGLGLTVARRARGSVPQSGALDRAMEAFRWIRSQRLPDGGWRAAEGGPADASLYTGAPGVLLFLAELHRRVPDGAERDAVRGEIESGVRFVADRVEPAALARNFGLYTGLAGTAVALDRCAAAIGPGPVTPVCERALALVREGAKEAGAGVEWDASLDIISGSAGIMLALLASGSPDDLALARKAGDRLIEQAIPDPPGARWPFQAGATRNMPNFSHGNAGVAFALATLGQATGERRFLDAAVAGAEYLCARADTTEGFRVFYDNIITPPIHYLGWCHGPVGTARLFWRLHQVQAQRPEWARTVHDCARAVMSSGIHEHADCGFWNNLGVCCGNAGVALFFLDLARATGREDYAAYARQHADLIDARAERTADGTKWTFAEHRRRPAELAAQTGLMQGAAGIGLMFVALDAHERGAPPPGALPDNPF